MTYTSMSEDPALVAVYFIVLAGLGLLVGSFLNVVIHRVPLGQSIVRPPSACPSCGTPIRARDNIPVISWVLLRGRCRSCQAAISARYPLIELLTCLVWAGLGWWALVEGIGGGINPLLPLLLVLGSAGIALTFIDLEHHRLPDAIVLPLYPITVLGLVFAGIVEGQWPVGATIAGALVWLVLIGGIWFLTGGRGMGFGDVKLAPILGATLGWVAFGASIVGLFSAFILGAVVGLALLLAGRAERRSHLPFGPFLLIGWLIGLVVGPALADAYVGWMGG